MQDLTPSPVRQPDITRARTLLGWEPTVGLGEGLRRTLAALEAGNSLPAGTTGRQITR